jgi:hypothetical protein
MPSIPSFAIAMPVRRNETTVKLLGVPLAMSALLEVDLADVAVVTSLSLSSDANGCAKFI